MRFTVRGCRWNELELARNNPVTRGGLRFWGDGIYETGKSMKSSRLRRCCSFPHGAALLIGLASLLGGGCRNLFVARHKVLVDAIAAKGTTKPAGLSYRLVAKRSIISATPVQIPVVKACVDAALATQGMFEPPASAAPDLFIEVSYGRDTAPRADPT